jgi:hypothetical protein
MGDMVDGRGFVSTADLETGLCGVWQMPHIVPFMSALSAQMNYSTTLTACTRNFCACCFLTLCYIQRIMIDYARPTILAENALKELHKAMLDRRYEDAIEAGLQAIAETRLAIHAIRETISKEARAKHDAF